MRRLFLSLAFVVTAGAVMAQPDATIEIRLAGRVGPPMPGRTPAAELELAADDARMRFQVEETLVTRGKRLGADVLAELAPYHPSLRLHGPAELLKEVASARAGDWLEITGQYRSGSRELNVTRARRLGPTRAGEGAAP
jgi:hypothetical protein